jgi:Putative auto-transporter adhesin, head GIN domain
MRSRSGFALGCAALLATAGCAYEVGDGRIETQAREVDVAFSRAAFHSGFRAHFVPGPRAVSITTDSNLLPLVETTVEEGTLIVRLRPDAVISTDFGLSAIVVTEEVLGVEGHGGSRVTVSASPGDRFVAWASGGSALEISALDARQLEADGSGGSTLTAAGSASAIRLAASSGSQLDAQSISADDVALDASGGSAVEARASRAVRGQLSGGSHATVFGHPAVRELSLSGGSTVDFAGE